MASCSRVQNVDRQVGERIRQRRILLGLAQQQMAKLLGVTCQQANKYEIRDRGKSRVGGPAL